MAGLKGIKGSGLVRETGGAVKSSVKKGKKAVVREVGKLAEKAYEQTTGVQKQAPAAPSIEPNGKEKKKQAEKRAAEIEATLRKVAQWQKKEVKKIEKERERLAQVREETLKKGQKEEDEEEGFAPLEWFKDVGKKAKGWAFRKDRKKKELKPAGYKG